MTDGGSSTIEPPPADIRARLVLAIDFDDIVPAVRLARELRPWFGVAKIGLELYSAVGPDAINSFASLGYDVFCDLKLHDIPNTVHRAARVLGSLGIRYLTIHTAGGLAMVQAGVEGLSEGADAAGAPAPTALGVSVLTSEADAPANLLLTRVGIAVEAGCGGIVCAASDLHEARQYAPALTMVVPGIRPHGAPVNDQNRVATPGEAFAAGADLLVIGRAVTAAEHPMAAAASIAAELQEAQSRALDPNPG